MKCAIQSSFPGEVIVDFGDASEKVLLRTACKDRVKPARW